MSNKLVIVESPSKAKTIHRILGDDFVVRASLGHVRDLPENRLGVDPDRGFRPQYVMLKSREKTLKEIRAAAQKASIVYLAPDPDREGEAIAWHLREVLREQVPLERFRRVTYNEITATAIRRAIERPSDIDMNKVDAQQARRILDRLVGYKVSPLLWRRIRGAESAGRVQSVALRLVCERERAIQQFVPEEYWLLGARVAKRIEPRAPFVIRLEQVDGEKANVPNEAEAAALREDLDDRELRVKAVIRREIVRRAPAPYITSSLQQAASRLLGFSPARTMRIAQSLYEGVDFGEGPVGLITYMRTDSVAVAQEAQASARRFIEKTYGAAFVPPKPNVYRSRASAQEAHEAIRPTDVERTPDALADRLKPEEARLYRLIWERFVASQMSPAIIAQRTVEIEAERKGASQHDFLFRARASEIVFPGYLKISGADTPILPERAEEGADEGEDDGTVPPLEKGEFLDRLEWMADQKFTQPPPRYSEATLVRALEENGIGRPSTYAQILSTLTERRYVLKQKRQLAPTPLGIATNDFLVEHLDALFNVGFTAQMEKALDEIEKGSVEWTAMIGHFYEQLKLWLKEARGPDGNADEARDLIEALSHVREWRPPPAMEEGRHRRALIGDQAFYESLRKQLEKGEKPLSVRQVEALKQLAARYRDQAPEIAAAAERWEIPADESSSSTPSETTMHKLRILRDVRFDAPRKVGRRVFDDAAFFQSLQRQAESGRSLTERQERYLDRLLQKYAEQIPHFESLAVELGLGAREPAEESKADTADVQRLLTAFEGVTEWKPPQKRGHRVWDDREFFRSVARQFRARGSITPKQLQALHKMAARYDLA